MYYIDMFSNYIVFDKNNFVLSHEDAWDKDDLIFNFHNQRHKWLLRLYLENGY